ncbi:hypothetical protein FJY84_00845 [Candidatus Bathyarchaeota archaeon]|nr:hypothetical protein [Candidatus Bathyarchaeota archaeon]
MFVAVYTYNIPAEKAKQFISLEKKAIKIYLEKGCTAVEIYRGMKDNTHWLEINRFQDFDHYNEVLKLINDDPQMIQLFEEFLKLISDINPSAEKKLYFRIL